MTPREGANVDQIQWEGLRQQASSFTYCVIDQTAKAIATAIAVQLGGRFFFATARHVIENNHEIEVLPRDSVATGVSNFAARRYHEQLDIGLLELKSDAADRFTFADSGRLLTTMDTDKELPALVIGYPGQFIRSTETPLTSEYWLRICRCDALTYQSFVLPESEWPDNDSLREPLACGRDLLVDFHPEQRIRHLPPSTSVSGTLEVDCPALDPRGLSGGGIWLAQVEDRNGLRLPDVRLIGIQSRWHVDSGRLVAVRVGAWLDMVRRTWPELAALV
jgi:hypothetical protein